MLPLRGLKIDPTLENKLRWIILLEVVGSTKYSNPTTSKYEDKISAISGSGTIPGLYSYRCYILLSHIGVKFYEGIQYVN